MIQKWDGLHVLDELIGVLRFGTTKKINHVLVCCCKNGNRYVGKKHGLNVNRTDEHRRKKRKIKEKEEWFIGRFEESLGSVEELG